LKPRIASSQFLSFAPAPDTREQPNFEMLIVAGGRDSMQVSGGECYPTELQNLNLVFIEIGFEFGMNLSFCIYCAT